MPPSFALPHGTRLHGGKFAVGAVLGQGGFGITYKGGDLSSKRYVAIKEFFPPGAIRQGCAVLPSNTTEALHARAIADFLKEAAMLARFQNSAIVRVIEAFEAHNSAYMVMEFLEGQTLGARIAARGRLDEWETLDIGLRIAGALETVHRAGLLHRDIKPDNIMLAPGGRAVLVDFGTARDFGAGAQAMTQIVTPGYAPIEQYAANARRGPATDIYALAATLYHALSGQQPVSATDRAADVPLPALRTLAEGVTPVVSQAIMSALHLDMARRPASARDFATLLRGQAPSPAPAALGAPAVFQPESGGALPIAPVASQPPASSTHGEDDLNAAIICLHSRLERHRAPVQALAFDPVQPHLASVGLDRTVHIWNWTRDNLSLFFGAHDQAITAVAFSPDGAWLATGGRDEKVFLWDASFAGYDQNAPSLGGRVPLATLSDCQGVVHTLAFSPARRALICGDAGALTLWDAQTGQIAARREVGCPRAQFSPDGARLAISSALSGALTFLDATTLQPQGGWSAHQGELTDFAFSPDGACLATSGSDGFVRVWRAFDGAMVWEQRPALVPAGCVVWSPDGRLLASASRDTVLLWTTQGGLWRRFTRHTNQVQAIAFAPQSAPPYRYVVASASRDKIVNICRIKADQLP